MELMKNTLVETNEQEASKKVKKLREKAAQVNEKLSILNDVEGLEPLKDKKEAIAFLQDPETVLAGKVVESFGDTFTIKKNINGRKLAELFYVPFDEIVENFRDVQWYSVSECDFEKGKFMLKDATIQSIYEAAKDYTETEEEEKIYQLQKQIADKLTEYWQILEKLEWPLPEKIRDAIGNMGLTYGVSNSQIYLKPDIKYIRRILQSDSHKEKIKNTKVGF